jgi:hypothetical protein
VARIAARRHPADSEAHACARQRAARESFRSARARRMKEERVRRSTGPTRQELSCVRAPSADAPQRDRDARCSRRCADLDIIRDRKQNRAASSDKDREPARHTQKHVSLRRVKSVSSRLVSSRLVSLRRQARSSHSSTGPASLPASRACEVRVRCSLVQDSERQRSAMPRLRR